MFGSSSVHPSRKRSAGLPCALPNLPELAARPREAAVNVRDRPDSSGPWPVAEVRGEWAVQNTGIHSTSNYWPLQLGAGVAPFVGGPHVMAGNRRVDLGGSQLDMAQQLLDGGQIGAPFEQVGGEGVA